MPTATELNLDAQTPEYLMSFWSKHQQGRSYTELFPQGGRGTKRATAGLANYACNKAIAINQRLAGNISTAIQYESICDRIYDSLPDFAKGW